MRARLFFVLFALSLPPVAALGCSPKSSPSAPTKGATTARPPAWEEPPQDQRTKDKQQIDTYTHH